MCTFNKRTIKKMILIGEPKTRYDLFFFFWTLFILSFVMNSIIAIGYWKKDIEKNLFDHNFLKWYHCKLCYEFIQLFQEKKRGYQMLSGRVWIARPRLSHWWNLKHNSLSDSIRYTKKTQLDRIKCKKLPLPPGYPNNTI